MSFREFDPRVAALAFAFTAAAFGIGVFALSDILFLMLAVSAVGVWAWSQQRELGEITFFQRALRGIVVYAALGISLLLAFELGRFLGEHT